MYTSSAVNVSEIHNIINSKNERSNKMLYRVTQTSFSRKPSCVCFKNFLCYSLTLYFYLIVHNIKNYFVISTNFHLTLLMKGEQVYLSKRRDVCFAVVKKFVVKKLFWRLYYFAIFFRRTRIHTYLRRTINDDRTDICWRIPVWWIKIATSHAKCLHFEMPTNWTAYHSFYLVCLFVYKVQMRKFTCLICSM